MIKTETNFNEKECVGCGTNFLYPIEMSDVSLYCTSTCEEQHSIFKESKMTSHVSEDETSKWN